jgi:Ca-activated chloride channel homolog
VTPFALAAAFAVALAPVSGPVFGPVFGGLGLLESKNAEVEQGNAALKAGKADDALAHYDKAIAKLPADAGAHFDRGAALYALSRFDEAGQEFLRATQAPDAKLKADAFLNLGNAFFKKEKFKEAALAYKRALALRAGDQTAKWNLELALAKQKEEEKKKQDKKDQNKDDKKDQDKDKQDKKDQKDQKDKQDDKKDQDKKDQNKKDQKDKDKKQDQKQDEKSEKDKQNQQQQDQQKDKQPQPQKEAADQQQVEAVLDNLERSSKDLEKARARLRAVRRRPPAKDW